MDALSNYLKNVILPLLKGEDHICRCLCAREQAYHVVPYHEASVEVSSSQNVTDVIPVMAGLVAVGVFIFWFLLWLVVILSSFIDDRSLSWKPKFRNAKDSLIPLCLQSTEEVSKDGADRLRCADDQIQKT